MFIKTADETIEALKIIRESVCSYGQKYGQHCDCKYGVTKEKFGKGRENGCGCPELYSAIELLGAIEQLQDANKNLQDELDEARFYLRLVREREQNGTRT